MLEGLILPQAPEHRMQGGRLREGAGIRPGRPRGRDLVMVTAGGTGEQHGEHDSPRVRP